VKTPHLDEIAKGGVVFDNAFSSCPMCGPYRGQVLTGKYSHMNGCTDNEYAIYKGQKTLPAVLGENGYKTAFIGKWHLGYPPYSEEKRNGFDYMAAYNCNHNHDYMSFYKNEEGPFQIDKWAPTAETDLTIEYMENHLKENGENPFCLLMSWGPPHWDKPDYEYGNYPEQFKIYKPEDVDLPENVPPQMEGFARNELAHYYGNISALDHEVGRVTQFLKDNNLEDNTIICFTSDHGDHLGSHGFGKPHDNWMHHTMRSSKATPYDDSIHIPFVLKYPAEVARNQRTKTLFNSVDIMPTLLSLAGIDIPGEVQGHDLSHTVLGKDGVEPDSVYLQILGSGWPYRSERVGLWRGLRTERWVYARWLKGQVWLFDRDNDPDEMNNLADLAEYKDIQDKLERRLQKWMEDTNDPFETGNRFPNSNILNIGQEFLHEKWDERRDEL